MPFESIQRVVRYSQRHHQVGWLFITLFSLLCTGVVAATRHDTFPVAQTGNIKGKVVADIPDQQKTLSGVTVKLSGDILSDKKLQTLSDDEGIYNFTSLTAGDYILSVELQGFTKYEQKVSVQIEATVELDILLKPQAITGTVTVVDDPANANKTESSVPGVITTATLRDAPLIDQRFQDALPLLPGIVRGPDGTLNIKGTRPTQSGILVSSLNVTDPVTGSPAIELPIEAVDTIQVHSNPYSAEFGKFTGAVTTIETRSGSNRWRYLFTGVLPRPRLRDGKIFGIGAVSPRVAVGGPIKKDKLFFFQSLEYRFLRNEVPSLENLNENERDLRRESFDSFTRIDYVINGIHRLTASFSLFPQKLDFANLNTFNPSATTANLHQRGWFVAINEQAAFKSGALLQSSLSAKEFDADVFGNSAASYSITPERNVGGWFDRQHRDSRRYEWLEVLNFAPKQWRGSHSAKTGFNFIRASFRGSDTSKAVRVVRTDGTTSQLIEFVGPGSLNQSENEYSLFLHDKWSPGSHLTLDLGLRYDRDGIGKQNNFAPRAGFALLPSGSDRTVVRGGVGIFFDKIPLNVGAFEQFQQFRVTTFNSDGTTIADGPRLYTNTIEATKVQNPYSVAWNLQADHEFTSRMLLRLGYEERHTRDDFFLEPVNQAGASGQLLLKNSSRSLYREFQVVARARLQEKRNLYLAYVKSESRGDLNDFNLYFGNFRHPVIRANEYGPQNFDTPHRLLFWGDISLPKDFVATPVVDWRSGFPFSLLDEDQNFVGLRNEGGRFPKLLTLDVLVTKGVSIPFRGKKYKGRVGLSVFNITNHWNPRDVQNNLDSMQFGTFFNSARRSFRTKFEIVKY
ncbi:MAG TPA: carboxypeptidase regulatory-like domain-containing protein [Pyrinomonadaceae bacterium]|nr:carboxypeptidase regulatory-like domain-containing protein [Pyrinomonadaceae bacterium]